jgi:glycerol-1-phosphate dehydrogenase [NAD(P)+]
MPLLARMLASPLFVDIRPGAIADLAGLLHRRNISTDGRVLLAVGRGQGEQIWAQLQAELPRADHFVVGGANLAAAGELQAALGAHGYDAVVAIGGGKTLDVAKYAGSRAALPMVAVATSLAHDGLCSPVASLEHPHGKGSFGVAMPIGVVVDLDLVRTAPPILVRGGIGDVVSNMSAIEDWRLAERERGESVDGLAMAFARNAAEAILHRDDSIENDDFVITLAESLVLSGMAMAVAGTSRPCSGADHEIIHAIDSLYPLTAGHGELAGLGALFSYHLRDNDNMFDLIACRLSQHELPRTPADLGLTDEQFVAAVREAPATRPDRYTILEHLDLEEAAIRDRVKAFVERLT